MQHGTDTNHWWIQDLTNGGEGGGAQPHMQEDPGKCS